MWTNELPCPAEDTNNTGRRMSECGESTGKHTIKEVDKEEQSRHHKAVHDSMWRTARINQHLSADNTRVHTFGTFYTNQLDQRQSTTIRASAVIVPCGGWSSSPQGLHTHQFKTWARRAFGQ